MNVTEVAPLQCLFLETSKQSCVPSRTMYIVVSYLASTPTITILLRLTPVTVLLDELAYYSYHPAPYDSSFKALVDLSWNITNTKWFPACLNVFAQSYQKYVADPATVTDSRVATPQILSEKGEDIFFLNMTLDYWVWTVPLTSFVFVLLYLLRKVIKKPLLKAILTPFSSLSYLLASIICDNVVFMTFRGFMQLQFLIPDRHNIFVSTFNLVLTVTTLWVAVCVGIAVPCFMYRWGTPFEIDGMRNRYGSYLLFSALQLLRIASGILHASGFPMPARLGSLATLHFLAFCLTIKNRHLMSLRGMIPTLLAQLLKLVLHGLLIFEVLHGQIQGSIVSDIFNNATAYAVGALLGLLILNMMV